MSTSRFTRRIWIGGALVALALFAAGAYIAATTWSDVNRVSIDRPEPETGPGPVASQEADPAGEDEPEAEPETITEPGRQVFLLVGSDSRENLEDIEGFGEFDGNRADVVMVLMKDGENTGLLSIPRDLLVENPCGGRENRISAMLQGCDDINGPTLLTMAVEETIGEPVDHFALVDLEGFQEVVDALGGYKICVEKPVRDRKAHLELDAGCTMADGAQTLAWMRSRRTQELTDNGWRTMSGVSDLARNQRQRDFLIDMMHRMADVSSPQGMASVGRTMAPFVTLDSQLSFLDAVDLAWTLRGLGSGSVVELEVPVHGATTNGGASVLVPDTPVSEIVAEFLSAAAASSGGVVLGVSG